MATTFMSPDLENWDLGDGVVVNKTGTFNFTAPADPDFGKIGAFLTDAINETIGFYEDWVPGGGGGGVTALESYWLGRTPDLAGYDIDFIRLVILSFRMFPSNGGTQVIESYSWEIWGHRVFVAFYPPTDPDGAYLIDRRATTVNVTLAEPGSAALEWAGMNQSMVGSGASWHLTMSGLANGVYAYRVWARDSAGTPFASSVRLLTVGAGIWTQRPVGYGFFPSIAFDAGGFPHLCYYGGDLSGKTGLVYARMASNEWVNVVLNPTTGSTGQGCSIAVDHRGTPHISYLEGPDYGGNYNLRYTFLNGTSWDSLVVAHVPYTTTSLALDPQTNRPRIAYYVVPSGGLMFASLDNGAWTIQTVESGYTGFNPSLALDSQGRPRIAYSSGTGQSLRYAEWTGTNWSNSTVDPSPVAGFSLRLDRVGGPHIAYDNATGLVYASRNGSTWTKELVDVKTFPSVSLALDGSDNPHIAYAMGWGGDVRYAVKNGSWTIQVVSHNMGDAGMTMALAQSGYAGMSFETNKSNGNLVFATDVVDTTGPTTTARLGGRIGTNGWYTSSVTVELNPVDWSGVDHTSFRVDGGPWSPYTGQAVVSADGRHTLEFFSTDLTGNVEPPQSISFGVDTSPPTIGSFGPSGTISQSDLEVRWTATDDTSGIAEYRIRVDGGAFRSLGQQTSATLHLADGAHRLEIEVIDEAGNVASQTLNVRVDTYAFSFTGPYLGIPTLLLSFGIAVAPPLVYAVSHWRNAGRLRSQTRGRAE